MIRGGQGVGMTAAAANGCAGAGACSTVAFTLGLGSVAEQADWLFRAAGDWPGNDW